MNGSLPIIGVVALLALAVYFFSQGGQATTGTTVVPGVDNSALDTAEAQANAALAQAHDANVATMFGEVVSFAGQQDEDSTQLGEAQVAAIQGIQTARYQEQAAAAQALAQQNAATNIANAQAHASQQNSFWTSLSSIFGSVAKDFAPTPVK